MNRQQISQLYDSFPEDQKDMPKEQFVKKTMSTLDPTKNAKILDAMVDRKRQITQGQIEQTRIDAAIKRSRWWNGWPD